MSQFVSIRITGTAEVKKFLSSLGEKAEKCLKITINETVRGVRTRLTTEIKNVFDRPNPRTQSAIRYTTLSVSQNRQTAEVYINYNPDGGIAPSKYLQAQIFGGHRALKRFEVLLQRRGFLPLGKIAIPGKDADMDQYGNMSRGQLIEILSQLGAFSESGYRANRSKGVSKYYIIPGAGIFYRSFGDWNGTRKCVMRFVRSTSYQKRFDFYGVAQKEADRIMMPKAIETFNYELAKMK